MVYMVAIIILAIVMSCVVSNADNIYDHEPWFHKHKR
jgi:hypothetical protein